MYKLPRGAKGIPGFPDYCVAKSGRAYSRRVYGSKTRRIGPWWELKPVDIRGYKRLHLYTEVGKYTPMMVHEAVLLAFVGTKPAGMETRHLNGNPSDNRLSNLKYGTPKENGQDRIRHGTSNAGEHHYKAKFTEDDIRDIRRRAASGERNCDIARLYKIGPMHCWDIIARKCWASVE